jgi:hypothetical protein
MTKRFRRVGGIVAGVAWLFSPAIAQDSEQRPAADPGAAHRELLLGHHVLLYEDGGAVDVTVTGAGGDASLRAVRRYAQDLAGGLMVGNFAAPPLRDAAPAPAVVAVRRLNHRIAYQYEATPAGGRVRMATRDPAALDALHTFLRALSAAAR